jgi:hypothetical protein
MEVDELTHRVTGEACGIDNCTSNIWTQNGDGTFSCQNGHVRAGQNEGEGEEGDFTGAVVRTTTTRKREKETREALGELISCHV